MGSFAMVTILFAGCEYFNEPITPADQKSPFPYKPMPLPELSEEYRNFKVDNITLQITEHDYVYGCQEYLYHRIYNVDESGDYAKTVHTLGSGGNPEVFKNEISITIPYDIYEFTFETVSASLVIYRYDLYRGYNFNFDDFEPLPASVDNKENHTVTVKTNTLRGRYIIGR